MQRKARLEEIFVQSIAALIGSPESGLTEMAKDESMTGLIDVELGTPFQGDYHVL